MIYASDLIGCKVIDESGETLGRVHDLRARRTPDGGWRLLGLVIGKNGMFARLAGNAATTLGRNIVSWHDVIRLDDGIVIVKSSHVMTS